MPDIQEQIFEAVDILVKKQIEAVKFDETIGAVVTDASRANTGEYVVSTGAAKFTAYSTETKYRENDAVLVTIPQGNYDNQKIIIGKQVDKMNTPLVYESPFNTIIDMTNNLIQGEHSWNYWANGGENNNLDPLEINRTYQGYTTIGIKAQFSTWLAEYSTIAGDYGLQVELTFKDLASGNTFTNSFNFDSSSFFGDIYNFETYYTQEQVFDISDFIDYPIVGIKITPYEKNNFITTTGERVEAPFDDFSTINPNIFIKDPYICLGIKSTDFITDKATIMADKPLTYFKYGEDRDNSNLRHIALQWIHKDTETNIIKAVEQNELPAGYEIRWYRYHLGAPSPDEFAGAHWDRFYGIKLAANLENGEWAITEQEINANENPATDLATDCIYINFQPNVNKQEEHIKAVIIKHESETVRRLIATSNTLIFINDDDVRSEATLIDANALSIRYDDDEKGHYFLYNEAGEVGTQEDLIVRQLTAVFDEQENNVYRKAPLNINDCASIKWIFPGANKKTMLVPMISNEPGATPITGNEPGWRIINDDYCFTQKTNTVYFIIKKHLNNNATENTIRLEIIKDGQEYRAQIQPIFGTAGTNGSDYTMVLTWLDGKNALNLSDGFDHTLRGEVALYDQAGNIVDWPDGTKLKATWKVAAFGNTDVRIKEVEDKDIFYPVFLDSDEPDERILNYDISGNPDRPYQQDGFYYFTDNNRLQDVDYYIYNNKTKAFQLSDSSLTNAQLYRKKQANEKKYKLEYQPIKFNEDPLNQETGIINHTYDNTPLTIEDNTKIYHYSSIKRYFIKINDEYILDPWEEYQEVETYYEPIEAKEKVYRVDANGNIINPVGGLTLTTNNQFITIVANASADINSLFILQLTLTNFGDYDLVSYYPISLKNGEMKDGDQQTFVVDYIEGPDRVRYASSGETDFNKNPYEINCRNWNGTSFDSIIPVGYWKLLFQNGESSYVNPSLIEDNTININGDNYLQYQHPLLSPPSLYISDAAAYGVQFVKKDGNNETVLWTQPILVYQNNYPSRTLNKWNGKEIVTDNDAGTITASGFSAGKKERDNTFTGVVIGDWSRSVADAAIAKSTGIYGFNHGAMAYAFKDDGTGFIGKDTKGRIYLDGDKSQIFSSNWANSDNQQGMLLDIDDGFIKMQSVDTNTDVYTKLISNIKEKYFTWQDGYTIKPNISLYKHDLDADQWIQITNQIINIGDEIANNDQGTDSFILSGDRDNVHYILLQFNENIKNTLNPSYVGRISTTASPNGLLNVTATYNPGATYYLKESGTRYITLGSNQPNTPLSIGTDKNIRNRRFRVDWDGTLHVIDGDFKGDISGSNISGSNVYASYLSAYDGNIGGWTIGQNTLTGGATTLHSSNGITTNYITINGNGASGIIGQTTGNNQNESTKLLGIRTTTGDGIAIETDQNIRLSGVGLTGNEQNKASGIYLYSNSLTVTANATDQHGIYARFA